MPFVLVPEVWSQAPRPAAMGIAVQMNWISNFIVGITFIFMQVRCNVFLLKCLLLSLYTVGTHIKGSNQSPDPLVFHNKTVMKMRRVTIRHCSRLP